VRRTKFLSISAVVLVVAVLGADRGAKLAAERVAAGRLQTALSTSQRPTVDLGGFPFLPDLISRKFSHITVDLVGASGGKVSIAHIHADLYGVSRQGDGIRADEISGYGNITYDALTKAATPLQVGFGGNGLIQITTTVTVLGRELSASASGRPRIEGNTLIIKPERAATSVTGDAGGAAAAVPEVRVALRNLPPNLKVKELVPIDPKVNADGVDFTFSGSNVVLSAAHSSAGGASPAAPAPVAWEVAAASIH
jgi:DUF2993 family protein